MSDGSFQSSQDDEASARQGATPAHAAQRTIVALVIVATALSPLAMNILVPIMPEFQRLFGIDYGVAELTLSLYLLAFAGGQFIIGPLSDVYGRRPVMLAGLAGFALGSLMCSLAPSIEWLLVGRLVQGLGGATGFVLGRAILRDLFSREKAAAMLSIVVGLMVIAPMFAPFLGGVTAELFGWQAIFHILMGITLIYLLACIVLLPETNRNRLESLDLTGLLDNYRALLAIRPMRGYIGVLGFSSGMFFGFIAGAPYIVVEVMELSPSTYGLWFMFASIGYMTGNLISSRYVERLGTDRLINIGNLCGLGASALLLAIHLSGNLTSPPALFLPMMLITFSNGLVISNATASAISLRPEIAGSGSGLTGGIQLMVGAIISNIVAHVQTGTALPTVLAMFLCAVMAKVMMQFTRP